MHDGQSEVLKTVKIFKDINVCLGSFGKSLISFPDDGSTAFYFGVKRPKTKRTVFADID